MLVFSNKILRNTRISRKILGNARINHFPRRYELGEAGLVDGPVVQHGDFAGLQLQPFARERHAAPTVTGERTAARRRWGLAISTKALDGHAELALQKPSRVADALAARVAQRLGRLGSQLGAAQLRQGRPRVPHPDRIKRGNTERPCRVHAPCEKEGELGRRREVRLGSAQITIMIAA